MAFLWTHWRSGYQYSGIPSYGEALPKKIQSLSEVRMLGEHAPTAGQPNRQNQGKKAGYEDHFQELELF